MGIMYLQSGNETLKSPDYGFQYVLVQKQIVVYLRYFPTSQLVASQLSQLASQLLARQLARANFEGTMDTKVFLYNFVVYIRTYDHMQNISNIYIYTQLLQYTNEAILILSTYTNNNNKYEGNKQVRYVRIIRSVIGTFIHSFERRYFLYLTKVLHIEHLQ